MNGWTKYYSNDTNLVGSDLDVEQELVSWSESSLDNMIACDLSHNDYFLKINGIGNYWQSDDYILDLSQPSGSPGTRICRRLQKQIDASEQYAKLIQHSVDKNFEVITYNEEQQDINGIVELATLTGKWLTLEIDLINDYVRFSILDSQV